MGVVVESERLKTAFEKIAGELARDPAFNTGVITVQTRLLENVKGEAVVGGHGKGYERSHSFITDERELLGGGGEGPAPLEYFIAGLNFCLQNTCVNWAAKLGVPIESLEIRSRAYFNRRGIYVEGDPAFTKILLEVKVDSPAEEARVRELIETTEKHCAAHRTLGKVVALERRLTVNGRSIE